MSNAINLKSKKMYYILTFIILSGSAELKREVVIYDREKAILFHDRKNFELPNSCKIDSLLLTNKNSKKWKVTKTVLKH